MDAWPAAVVKFANAIKVAEGSNPAWNNPGDLTGSDAGAFPTCGVANAEGVLIFKNAEDGWNALCIKVNRFLSGKSKVYPLKYTIAQVGSMYSAGDPAWAKNVAAELGVDPSMTLAEWVGLNPLSVPASNSQS